ncbi:hypothetical protein OUZ56_012855 [Daphnia magna]|uniref:Uncharacterized protein n=1 Tax=Daphnia magna TaxID=35525 RepID=A0ABQ9Z489_9CRUS|nr:hypothetical protein OUZ56_012855 [Daphnia magna]
MRLAILANFFLFCGLTFIILPGFNIVADTESAIGSGSESHIGPEMDKVWRLKLEMTRADVRFQYATNNGAKQHWTNIQHYNIKN